MRRQDRDDTPATVRHCRDCAETFVLTASEVTFYTTTVGDDGRQLHLPKQCPACRRWRKAERASQESAA